MKLFVLLCLVAAAFAAPPFDADILRYDNNNIGVGDFSYAFESSDGTKQEAVGELKNEGRDGEALKIKGSYSWVAPDNVRYLVTYEADELGYRSNIQKDGVSKALFA
ncbi:unnamed protein product, partial [Brenthis ino]